MSLKFKDYLKIAQSRGALNAICELWDFLYLDWRCGTETAHRFNSTDERYNGYVGIYTLIVSRGLKFITNHSSSPTLQDFLFVDIGCGKGKPLITAARLNCMHAFGLEISEYLYNTAQKNIGACSLGNVVTVIHGDATKIGIDEILHGIKFKKKKARGIIFFAYNPFDEQLLKNIVDKWSAELECTENYLFFCGDSGSDFPFEKLTSISFGNDGTRYSKIYSLSLR